MTANRISTYLQDTAPHAPPDCKSSTRIWESVTGDRGVAMEREGMPWPDCRASESSWAKKDFPFAAAESWATGI